MRTNIIIDDQLMSEALDLTNCKTKKGVVDQALKLLVRVKKQEKIRRSRGRLRWDGNLDDMRTD